MKKGIKKALIITVTTIGIVAAGYLAISVGFKGIYAKMEMNQNQKLAVQNQSFQKAMFGELKHQTAVETTDEHLAKRRAELDSETVPAIVRSDADSITEEFTVTQIDEHGYVHASTPGGKDERINYSINTFKQYGISDVKVGDTIDVTWPIDAYENSNRENIENIEIVM